MKIETVIKNQPITKTEVQKHTRKSPWNKGNLIGQKPPLKLKEVWEIRIRLQLDKRNVNLPCLTLP